MAKFMILYKTSASAKDLMANSTPEEMKASMDEWTKWKENLDDSMSMEWGLPLQGVSEVTATEIRDSQSPISGYATMEGEKDAITEVLKTHPHLKRSDASIEVLEMISMPGM